MEYLVIGLLLLAFFLAKGILDKKKYAKSLRQRLLAEFGTVSKETYSTEKLAFIRQYFEAVRRPAYDIDDTTWNDLELDELYFVLNRTVSAIGEEYLYAMLRQPEFDPEELAERERLISFFKTNTEGRLTVQTALAQIGKNRKYSVYACMNFMKQLKRESNVFHYASAALLLASVGLVFFQPAVGAFATMVVVILNFVTYVKRKGEMEAYLSTAGILIRLLCSSEKLAECKLPEIAVYAERMKTLQRRFASFKRNYWIVASKKPTGDILDAVMTYFRMLFHLDLIKFNSMLKIYDAQEEKLKELYQVAGYLDALCAVASFRALLGEDGYCVPELLPESLPKKDLAGNGCGADGTGAGKKEHSPVYEAELLYHPLLSTPVKNSIRADKSVLLTGSNASGKSTFLKAVAINALLAQTMHTATAKAYRASYFQILSSMALRDNMQENESYFIVEIKSLKRIYEATKAPVCTLCFVDEVLRGTNTVERIAASKEVLLGLAKSSRTICFAATHDIELTYLLEQACDNYHFEETVTEDTVTFDYRLHGGRAASRNAIRLLRMLGYPETMIKKAEATAEHFLTTGEWT